LFSTNSVCFPHIFWSFVLSSQIFHICFHPRFLQKLRFLSRKNTALSCCPLRSSRLLQWLTIKYVRRREMLSNYSSHWRPYDHYERDFQYITRQRCQSSAMHSRKPFGCNNLTWMKWSKVEFGLSCCSWINTRSMLMIGLNTSLPNLEWSSTVP